MLLKVDVDVLATCQHTCSGEHLSYLPLRERPPDTVCLHSKCSSLCRRQTICRQIWTLKFHELIEKKTSLNRTGMAQVHQSFSNIWIQWSAFVQSAVARATQMCWQGFSQSAISRTASYNPPPPSPNPAALFKHLAPASLSLLSLYLAL